MANLKFILQYIIKPRTTGAILPSSRFLARKMVADINFATAKCVVEYGPGTGVFTEELLRNRNENTVLLLIERNEDFCNILREKYSGIPNLHIIEDSAENIGAHLQAHGFTHACRILSGLPFASLPPQISENILTETRKFLSPQGSFTTFQYTLFKKKIFARYFSNLAVKREFRNVPPAYILTFRH
ncbi:MAG: SAM-dependent methyltransferase [Defluviitaleaceae bacterium]|nr:SAM-dependent methyltransferase [Defluviitaleaceae bacterium]MCL2263151.1 SAM-dependent methyltransferase [Defluviitaleaceae bacterium]